MALTPAQRLAENKRKQAAKSARVQNPTITGAQGAARQAAGLGDAAENRSAFDKDLAAGGTTFTNKANADASFADAQEKSLAAAPVATAPVKSPEEMKRDRLEESATAGGFDTKDVSSIPLTAEQRGDQIRGTQEKQTTRLEQKLAESKRLASEQRKRELSAAQAERAALTPGADGLTSGTAQESARGAEGRGAASRFAGETLFTQQVSQQREDLNLKQEQVRQLEIAGTADQIAEARAEAKKAELGLAELEQASLAAELEQAGTQLGLIKDLSPSEIANFSSEQIGKFYESAGLPASAGIAFHTLNSQLAEELAKGAQANPEVVQNLQQQLGTVKAESQSADQKKLGFLTELRDAGQLSSADFNTAVQGLAGITQAKFGFEEREDGMYATNPQTGQAHRVATNASGNPIAPSYADVGTGKITQDYGTNVSKFNPKDHVPLQNGASGTPGMDFDGVPGDAVQAFVAGTITQVADAGGYGNQVIVTDANGNEHMYSHLQGLPEELMGKQIGAGDVVGYIGNTGTVFGLDGNPPQEGDLQTGSHLDYRVRSQNTVNGSRWANPNDFILSKEERDTVKLSSIFTFNDKITRRDMKTAEVDRIADKKADIMTDPEADIVDVLRWSSGGATPTAEQTKPLDKFGETLDNLEAITETIDGQATGPMIGRLRGMNPFDIDRKFIEAQITGAIPGLARGVYGEVGVLTDNDIALYRKTLPNLESEPELIDLLLAHTTRKLASGYKKKLQLMAGTGRDVSGLAGVYDSLVSKSDVLLQQAGLQEDVAPEEPVPLTPVQQLDQDELVTLDAELAALDAEAAALNATPTAAPVSTPKR